MLHKEKLHQFGPIYSYAIFRHKRKSSLVHVEIRPYSSVYSVFSFHVAGKQNLKKAWFIILGISPVVRY